jgi:16S rRNA processing protein RimM
MTNARDHLPMSPTEKPRRILVGEITGAHGIRGDVLIRTYTEAPGAIASYGPLTDATGRSSFSLHVVRATSKGIVARVGGIEDRNGAERLRGTKLYIERAKLPKTSEAEFYHADLIGLRAVAADGGILGEIVSVQNFGAGDLLELKLQGDSDTEFIPFEDRWVPSVDLASGTIVVNRLAEPEADDDAPPPDAEEDPS